MSVILGEVGSVFGGVTVRVKEVNDLAYPAVQFQLVDPQLGSYDMWTMGEAQVKELLAVLVPWVGSIGKPPEKPTVVPRG